MAHRTHGGLDMEPLISEHMLKYKATCCTSNGNIATIRVIGAGYGNLMCDREDQARARAGARIDPPPWAALIRNTY